MTLDGGDDPTGHRQRKQKTDSPGTTGHTGIGIDWDDHNTTYIRVLRNVHRHVHVHLLHVHPVPRYRVYIKGVHILSCA